MRSCPRCAVCCPGSRFWRCRPPRSRRPPRRRARVRAILADDDGDLDSEVPIDREHVDHARRRDDARAQPGARCPSCRALEATHLATTWALSPDPLRRTADRTRARVGLPAARRRADHRPPVARRRSAIRAPRAHAPRGSAAPRGGDAGRARPPHRRTPDPEVRSIAAARTTALTSADSTPKPCYTGPVLETLAKGFQSRPPAPDRRRRAHRRSHRRSAARRPAVAARRRRRVPRRQALPRAGPRAARGKQVELRAKSKEYGTKTITPEQAFIAICQDELIKMMGPVDTDLKLGQEGRRPAS